MESTTIHNVPRDKVISVEKALEVMQGVFKQFDTPMGDAKIMSLLAASCPIVTYQGTDCCRMADFYNFTQNFVQAYRTGDSNFLQQKRGLAVERIVDIQEFIESKDYLCQKGSVRPHVMRGLNRLFSTDQYIECCLSGAIGWGKSYFSEMAMAYMIYRLSCYHNPQLEFGLAPGSSIFFIQQSKKFELAKKVLFEQFAARLDQSPYFKKYFPFDPHVKSELRFPRNIYVLPIGGTDTSALGMNVFGGIIDEMNFMARVVDSASNRFSGQEEYDQAESLYTTLIRRMKSRFLQNGKLPGKLLLVSSVNYPGDFTDRKMKEARTDNTILALRYNLWEVVPDRFSGEKFLLEIGSDEKQSRIIPSLEDAVDPDDVIEVPIEYKRDFERDMNAALRDLAGITTGVNQPFIPNKELIIKASQEFEALTNGNQLFRSPSVVINDIIDQDMQNWPLLINMDYVENIILNRDMIFTVHVDPSITHDSCGIAIGHISGYKLMTSTKVYDKRLGNFVEIRDMRAPIYHIDGILRVLPPKDGREIDLELIRDMILWLKGVLNLKWATMDSYQSRMMIQAFRKTHIRSGLLSVDEDLAPYAELKSAIRDERILYPAHDTFLKEVREVEKDKKREKIDHPASGSKDCSDAVAGVVYLLQTKEARYGITGRYYSRDQHSEMDIKAASEPKVRHVMLEGGRKKRKW